MAENDDIDDVVYRGIRPEDIIDDARECARCGQQSNILRPQPFSSKPDRAPMYGGTDEDGM